MKPANEFWGIEAVQLCLDEQNWWQQRIDDFADDGKPSTTGKAM